MENYKHREPMRSQRSIEKAYKAMVIKIADENRINCYTCKVCGHVTKTIDRHAGVTPMFNVCVSCGGESVSSWYKDIAPDLKVTHEWVIPTLSELIKQRKNPGLIDHILRGGLDFRVIKYDSGGAFFTEEKIGRAIYIDDAAKTVGVIEGLKAEVERLKEENQRLKESCKVDFINMIEKIGPVDYNQLSEVCGCLNFINETAESALKDLQ